MSDDGGGGGGGGGDTGGGDSNDYSTNNDYNNDTSYTHADNNYSGIGSTLSALSSAIDFTSAVESTTSAIDNHSSNARSNNDYSGIGSTVHTFESATESTISTFDNNDYSSTRLQIDDSPSAGRYLSPNYSKRSNYNHGTRYIKYTPSNSTWTGNTRSSEGSLGNCNGSINYVICISVILLVIVVIGLIIAAHNHRPSTYKPIKLKPLPQGVYNSEKIDWAEFERNFNNSLKLLDST